MNIDLSECGKFTIICDDYHVELYDSNNNEIYYKGSNGVERLYEYDSHDNLIHSKMSEGYEEWYEYNSHDNKTYFKNSNGSDIQKEYQDGRVGHLKYSNNK